jgi:hypothetical protein
MGRVIAIDAEDAQAATRQMYGRRAADGAETGEDDVVGHGDNLACVWPAEAALLMVGFGPTSAYA